MRKILFLLLLLPAMMMAKDIHEADTLWVNKHYKIAEQEDATFCGFVKHVDTIENVATIEYYTIENPRLVAIRHQVALGDGAGYSKGEQLYFNEEGTLESKQIYTVIYNQQRKSKVSNRLTKETLFYPDGNTKEELTITYTKEDKKEKRTYDRQCYYPEGALQYEEHFDGKETYTVYYKPNGKVDRKPKEKIEPYETPPSFPGGLNALFEYLNQNVKYPPIARKNNIQGRVIVQFVVGKNGKIKDVEVVRSGGDPSLDKEAARVIKSMPQWIPGKQRGVPVRVKYTAPVNFKL